MSQYLIIYIYDYSEIWRDLYIFVTIWSVWMFISMQFSVIRIEYFNILRCNFNWGDFS